MSEEVKQAAREMAQQALKKKLQEIDMAMEDVKTLEEYHRNIRKEIDQLKVILQQLEAKDKERAWLKNQNAGDLDDNRLGKSLFESFFFWFLKNPFFFF